MTKNPLFNNLLRFPIASHIFITRIYFVSAIYLRKNGRTHSEFILRNPTFESRLHGSMELFSGFQAVATVRSWFPHPTVYENLRARTRMMTYVIARTGRKWIFVFRNDHRASIDEILSRF